MSAPVEDAVTDCDSVGLDLKRQASQIGGVTVVNGDEPTVAVTTVTETPAFNGTAIGVRRPATMGTHIDQRLHMPRTNGVPGHPPLQSQEWSSVTLETGGAEGRR